MTIDQALAWLRGLDEGRPDGIRSDVDLAHKVRNVLPQLIGVVAAAGKIDDCSHTDDITFEMQDQLHDALTALAAAVEKESK